MRILFFGSGAFGLPTLKTLARAHEVSMVITQPDRKAGRGGRLTPTPIGAWAAEHLAKGTTAVPLLKPERVNEPEVIEQIRATEADAWVVIAFGQKLGQPLLADRFAINLHASLLPRWRGAAPINAAILAGDTTTGNSVITLADRMDAGLVLGRSERPIAPTATASELHDQLAADGPELVLRVLAAHEAGRVPAVEQDEAQVTLAPKLSRADSWIDCTDSADACSRRINGLSPWPGVQAEIAGIALKLLRAQPHQDAHKTPTPASAPTAPPGTLLDPAAGLIACGEGVLQLLEVQPSGKKPMAWADFARGRALEAGCVLTAHTPEP
ncbi:Methionyl-tRNA formyltransferase [hydrothermal vent metagenome]|uniref:methionyl-tRNA formyltransferase n=1 Tax=hydrothermal vent metagenome TaxID=652676 RepID=A0A3B1D834_9ZZZZ